MESPVAIIVAQQKGTPQKNIFVDDCGVTYEKFLGYTELQYKPENGDIKCPKEIAVEGFSGIYTGQWKNGRPHGSGQFIYKMDGTVYEGEFQNGKRQGKCIETYPSGQRYDGYFDKGYLEGDITYYYDTGDVYTGKFHMGFREGKGTLQYANGDKYVGHWKEDEKHGTGVYFFNNNERFEGKWKLGMRSNLGVYYFVDGSRYEGMYLRDMRHGEGRLINSKGKQYYKGRWKYGVNKQLEEMQEQERLKSASIFQKVFTKNKNKSSSNCSCIPNTFNG